jgi:hypothetical protein
MNTFVKHLLGIVLFITLVNTYPQEAFTLDQELSGVEQLLKDSGLKNYKIDDLISEEMADAQVALTKIIENPNIFKNEYRLKLKDRVDPKYHNLLVELGYLQVIMTGMIGIIASLPEDVSKWEKDKLNEKSAVERWKENVKTKPVKDSDDFAINWIGHPVSGSAYYVWGRMNGLSWQESATLTFLSSTFLWEYGYEALAEVPSIQDLIITPVFGSLLGEVSHRYYLKVMNNGGKILNSKILGSIGRGLLNPIGELNAHFHNFFKTFSRNIKVSSDIELISPPNHFNHTSALDPEIYPSLSIQFIFK